MFIIAKHLARGLIMPKLIIGILAVAFLQIGFMAYLAADQQEIAFNRVSSATVPVRDAIINNYEDMDDEYGPLEIDSLRFSDEITQGNGSRSEFVAVKATASHQARIIPSRTLYPIESNAGRGALKVVVTDPYANKKSDEAKIFRDRTPPNVSEEPRSRSVIARVIKKPFDWLKAVGSKLRS